LPWGIVKKEGKKPMLETNFERNRKNKQKYKIMFEIFLFKFAKGSKCKKNCTNRLITYNE
jgi:hypothetical protein